MRCLHDVSPFLFKFQRFSAFSAALLRAAGRRRRGKTLKRGCDVCMTFRPSCSNFSVFLRFQRHHCVQYAAEHAERRRREDVMSA
jgi:hypothetical protein